VLKVLGDFSMTVGGQPVDARAWQSRKARDLLKILAVNRGRPVTREAAMEWLWPESDPAALPARLSVALSTLRSVLGPAREGILADRTAMALDLGLITLDLEEFLKLAEGPDPAAAAAAYTGELLPADVFAEWAAMPREEAGSVFVTVAHEASQQALAKGLAGDAAVLCRRILSRDAYDERAHRRLIKALQLDGAHGEARRAQANYAAKMAELGLPSPIAPGR
jgi:DNA-binding SARP family transcriptional activator